MDGLAGCDMEIYGRFGAKCGAPDRAWWGRFRCGAAGELGPVGVSSGSYVAAGMGV